jgi:hypothetical protein
MSLTDNHQLISKYYNKLQEREEYDSRIVELREKNDKLNDEFHMMLFSYSTEDIVKLLDIKLQTKDLLKKKINKIGIYRRKSLFVIRYICDKSEYRFTVNNRYEIEIKKDNKKLISYDLIREFRPLNFNNINGTFVVENYVNLVIKSENIR